MTDYVAALANPCSTFHREAADLVRKLHNSATITNGVIRWNSNGQVPPADVVALAASFLVVDVPACDAARSADLGAFLAQYRASRARRTPAERAEEAAAARAAHGPGVELVNVLTGERYRT